MDCSQFFMVITLFQSYIFPSHIGTMVDHFNFLVITFVIIITIITIIIIILTFIFKMNHFLCVKNYTKYFLYSYDKEIIILFALAESLTSLFNVSQMVNSGADILNPVLTDLLPCPPQKFPFAHFHAYGCDLITKPIYNRCYCSHFISPLFFFFWGKKRGGLNFFPSCARYNSVSMKKTYIQLQKANLLK